MALNIRFDPAKFKAEIELKGWNPNHFAMLLELIVPADLNVTKPTVYGWVKGDFKPGIDYLPYFQMLFGLKASDIFKRLYSEETVQ